MIDTTMPAVVESGGYACMLRLTSRIERKL